MVKKKMTAYNRHVQKEMKAGRTMKQAATSWKGRVKRTPSKRSRQPRRAVRTQRRTQNTMVKRKKRTVRRSSVPKPMDLALGAAIFSVVEPMADRLTQNFALGIPDEFVKIGGGIMLMKKYPRDKIASGVGIAATVIGINRLMTGGLNIATAAVKAPGAAQLARTAY